MRDPSTGEHGEAERGRQHEDREHDGGIAGVERGPAEPRDRETEEKDRERTERLEAHRRPRAEIDLDPVTVERGAEQREQGQEQHRDEQHEGLRVLLAADEADQRPANANHGVTGSPHGVPVCWNWKTSVESHGSSMRPPTAIATTTRGAARRVAGLPRRHATRSPTPTTATT